MRSVATSGGRRTGIAAFAVLFVLALTVPAVLAAGSARCIPTGSPAPAPTRSGAPARTAAARSTGAPSCTPTPPPASTCCWARRRSGPAPPTSWSGTRAWSRAPWAWNRCRRRPRTAAPPSGPRAASPPRGRSPAAPQELAGPDTVPAGVPSGYTALLLPGAGHRHLQHRHGRPVGVQQRHRRPARDRHRADQPAQLRRHPEHLRRRLGRHRARHLSDASPPPVPAACSRTCSRCTRAATVIRSTS